MAKKKQHTIQPELGERLEADGSVRGPATLELPAGPVLAKPGGSIDPVKAGLEGPEPERTVVSARQLADRERPGPPAKKRPRKRARKES